MSFYPYRVDYWPDEESLSSDNNHLTYQRIEVPAADRRDAEERFLAMGIKSVYFVIHEPILED